jgi:hydroxyacylglutathione hydrolase
MIHFFEFSPFAENTYIVWNEQRDCIIIDPGCYDVRECGRLKGWIEANELRPVRLINTHCHLDHVFGNHFVHRVWGLLPEFHVNELPVLERFPVVCQMYGIPNVTMSPMPERFIETDTIIELGDMVLKVLFTPGHSPGSLSFYNENEGWVIAGDTLFYGSIGRTDLPGGHHATLIESIENQLFTLPPATLVYSGHGPSTTVRHEQETNPFF